MISPLSKAVTDMYGDLTNEQTTRVQELTQQFRCLVCQNQDLADSNAPLAIDLRNEIVKQVKEGESDQKIRDYLVARYGEFILFKPPVNRMTYLLWLGPLVLVIAGLLVLVWLIKRR